MLLLAVLVEGGERVIRISPEEQARCEIFMGYKVFHDGKTYYIDLCFKPEEGRSGYHVYALHRGSIVREFRPVKDYEREGYLLTLARARRGPRGKLKMLDIDEVPNEIKKCYKLKEHREVYPGRKGYGKAAILVESSRIDKMPRTITIEDKRCGLE